MIQVNGLTRPIFSRYAKLEELVDCDLCLGFYVFTFLAWVFSINLIAPVYIPVLSEVFSGLIAAFAAHIFRIGWTSKFGITRI